MTQSKAVAVKPSNPFREIVRALDVDTFHRVLKPAVILAMRLKLREKNIVLGGGEHQRAVHGNDIVDMFNRALGAEKLGFGKHAQLPCGLQSNRARRWVLITVGELSKDLITEHHPVTASTSGLRRGLQKIKSFYKQALASRTPCASIQDLAQFIGLIEDHALRYLEQNPNPESWQAWREAYENYTSGLKLVKSHMADVMANPALARRGVNWGVYEAQLDAEQTALENPPLHKKRDLQNFKVMLRQRLLRVCGKEDVTALEQFQLQMRALLESSNLQGSDLDEHKASICQEIRCLIDQASGERQRRLGLSTRGGTTKVYKHMALEQVIRKSVGAARAKGEKVWPNSFENCLPEGLSPDMQGQALTELELLKEAPRLAATAWDAYVNQQPDEKGKLKSSLSFLSHSATSKFVRGYIEQALLHEQSMFYTTIGFEVEKAKRAWYQAYTQQTQTNNPPLDAFISDGLQSQYAQRVGDILNNLNPDNVIAQYTPQSEEPKEEPAIKVIRKAKRKKSKNHAEQYLGKELPICNIGYLEPYQIKAFFENRHQYVEEPLGLEGINTALTSCLVPKSKEQMEEERKYNTPKPERRSERVRGLKGVSQQVSPHGRPFPRRDLKPYTETILAMTSFEWAQTLKNQEKPIFQVIEGRDS